MCHKSIIQPGTLNFSVTLARNHTYYCSCLKGPTLILIHCLMPFLEPYSQVVPKHMPLIDPCAL